MAHHNTQNTRVSHDSSDLERRLDQLERKLYGLRAFVVVAVVLLAVVLAVPMLAGATESADNRCPASASICIYRLPDDIEAARSACYRAEREERGIPGDRDAYIAWYEAHRGTSAGADWDRAYQRCKDQNELPGGKWAWDQMIYVGSR